MAIRKGYDTARYGDASAITNPEATMRATLAKKFNKYIDNSLSMIVVS